MKIAVAMSGGVDSSVTAALLQKEGHEIFGLTMLVTPSDEAASAAREAAETLGIPHHTVDFREVFMRQVISPFCLQYCLGRTPESLCQLQPPHQIWRFAGKSQGVRRGPPSPPAIMPGMKNNPGRVCAAQRR